MHSLTPRSGWCLMGSQHETAKSCPKCNEQNHGDAQYCRQCGEPLEAGNAKQGLRAVIPAILVCICGLVLLVMSVFALYGAQLGCPGDLVDDVAGKPIAAVSVLFLPIASIWAFFAWRTGQASCHARLPKVVPVAGGICFISLWLAVMLLNFALITVVNMIRGMN